VATEEARITLSGKSALKEMAERQISLHPKNYAVWYEYYFGANQELVTDLSHYIDSGTPVTNQVHAYLYEKHIVNQHEKEIARKAADETRTILRGILDRLMQASASSGNFRDEMKRYSAELRDAEDLSQVRQVVEQVIEHTNDMVSSSLDLQRQLEEESARASSLHSRLEQAQREALTDPLTGLSNRKALDYTLEELLREFGATGLVFSVLMLDVDFFKKVNDRHGHTVGDAVLRMVAKTIGQCTRGGDLSVRYGGEEFAVVLPATTLAPAAVVAEHIRSTMEKVRFKITTSGHILPPITISIGVAQVRQGDAAEALVGRADRALYEAKHSGRNTVKTAV
jgi:diguanylate cyclase